MAGPRPRRGGREKKKRRPGRPPHPPPEEPTRRRPPPAPRFPAPPPPPQAAAEPFPVNERPFWRRRGIDYGPPRSPYTTLIIATLVVLSCFGACIFFSLV